MVIELRLADGAPRVDSSLRLASPDEARAPAARLLPAHQRELLRRWGSDPRLGYPRPVSALWLEFDLDRRDEAGPWPLLCARLEEPTDPDWLVRVLLPSLRGRPLGLRQARAVARVVSTLPPAARLLYAFCLDPRLDGAVRLELFGLEPAEMAGFLERSGAPTAAAQAARLAPLAGGADRYHLALDVIGEVLPRIGVECGWRRPPRRDPRWRRFLDRLVAAGLASAAKADAVLSWPGHDTLWSAPSTWPEEAVSRGGYLVRCLSHLKLASSPGREPEAKAYLLFQHYLRRPQRGPAASAIRPSARRARSTP